MKRVAIRFQVIIVQINSKLRNVQKLCAALEKSFLLLIRPNDFFCRSRCGGRLALSDSNFCLAALLGRA